MKAHEPIKVGAVYGGTTVLGPAVPEWRKGMRFVHVECWSCKARRDVALWFLQHGQSRICATCARSRPQWKMSRPAGYTGLGAASYSGWSDEELDALRGRVGP